MPRWNPQDKLAVVTGASSGIGRCLCRQLVGLGCRVIAVARRQDKLEELQQEIAQASPEASERLLLLTGDITEGSTRERIRGAIQSQGDRLDLLVNNAGIGAIGPFLDASPSRLQRVMQVNFLAPAELTRHLLPSLLRSGDAVICNVGSVLGHRAVPDKSEYCASKFAMHGWSDSLRAELAGSGVQVTLVSPSTTKSEFFDSLVETDAGTSSKSLGSWTPERVAKATVTAIRRRRDEVILSVPGKLLVYADRCCPPLMNWLLKKRPNKP
ncbi:SDR family NAD(P)-dependent oxidoreductase [Roseiconus nitratireducens]|uniref:SDR family NAD(P)-dependent oxidoreductase n=1 Tax=Roseiconus nitratireducens TaxID=2605748 RepID=A0A5M6D815_9BACT|nr:SDR family NAD(P)-dependent oxidoreductase [Roseiconus nitratireducens]KAA5543667.1 SDR family NAD(P)-dependent oxidoreductase [Roseiconus nitratireducens]